MTPIALTMGEPAGIGPDITIAAWRRRKDLGLPIFYWIGDPAVISDRADRLGHSINIEILKNPRSAIEHFGDSLPVFPLQQTGRIIPGRPSAKSAPKVTRAIDVAVEHAMDGKAAAIVTNPISKSVLYEAGFEHPGHTEYLAHLAGSGTLATMMLCIPELRVVPVTIHLPLSKAVAALSMSGIVRTGQATAKALENDFGIPSPRIAVAALNPHGGEDGALGDEEIEVIGPAVEALNALGVRTSGPFPADTLFHEAARAEYDAVLCMYHDQALIPLKTLNFHEGVNVTLGLPFIRTSPDHGTAFDIAGTGQANPHSLIAALQMARTIADHKARLHARSAA